MSSYFNNLLTNTTSKYNTLRQQLLSNEADGDTEDDSHISRVLRAYYTEKGRPFPQWLPPDPKAPQAAPMVSSARRQYGQMAPPPQQMGRGGGAISDLWDAPAQQPPLQQEPQSLRRAQGRSGGAARRPMGDSLTPEPQSQGRPLPSQRAGSYQNGPAYRPAEPSPPPSAGSGQTAQDRLKARLWGSGRAGSPGPQNSSQHSSPASTPAAAPMRNPYERSNYDRPSGGGGARAPYQDDRSRGYPPTGGSGRQQDEYNMSANSPFFSSDDPYAPQASYGGRDRSDRGGGRVGLPSGPRMR